MLPALTMICYGDLQSLNYDITIMDSTHTDIDQLDICISDISQEL